MQTTNEHEFGELIDERNADGTRGERPANGVTDAW